MNETQQSVAGSISALHRKLRLFAKLGSDEFRVLDQIVRNSQDIPARTVLGREGDSKNECYILLEGWGFCYKDLEDGGRQIINFRLAGDLMGIRNRLFQVSDHSYGTITKSKVAVLSFDRFQEIIENMPGLGQALLWTIARDEAMISEHLVSLGRRDANERISHLLMELADRMEFAGIAPEGVLKCPLTQEHLADALGLTSIHVNRILRSLRERGLVTLSHGELIIQDLHGLKALAGYDDEYLDQEEGE